MKNPFLPLCLALVTAFLRPSAQAQVQGGAVLKTFDLQAGKLLVDPGRPQLYATLPAANSVAVINTDTNTVISTIAVGSDPVDLAISPDGTRLYVANSGSTTAGVGVVDLTTLTALPSLPTPFAPGTIAAGLGNRLYLLAARLALPGSGPGLNIAQIDGTTGASLEAFPTQVSYITGSLAITPDYKTLFVGTGGILSFDVSTATPTLLQENATGGFGELLISHDGQYLVPPGSGTSEIADNITSLISTTNLNDIVGTFAIGSYCGPAAFSADDSKVYQVQLQGDNPKDALKVFDTTTFALLASFPLPASVVDGDSPATVTSLAVTAPNNYLYVAATGIAGDSYANLMLVSTQTPPFFDGSAALDDGFYYLQFSDGNLFGYYNFNTVPLLFHLDLGFEYPFDAADGSGGIYLYDFTSQTFFYTSASLFPYLYDFTLNSFLYYYPNTRVPGHYTAYPRYFYNFATGQIITK